MMDSGRRKGLEGKVVVGGGTDVAVVPGGGEESLFRVPDFSWKRILERPSCAYVSTFLDGPHKHISALTH